MTTKKSPALVPWGGGGRWPKSCQLGQTANGIGLRRGLSFQRLITALHKTGLKPVAPRVAFGLTAGAAYA